MKNFNEIEDIEYLFLLNMNAENIIKFSKKCNIHIGTIKRWKEQKRIPKNYIIDLIMFLINEVISNNNDKKKLLSFLKKIIKKLDVKEKDQYYTKLEIAKYVYNKSIDFIKKWNINLSEYTFIDPAAGNGVFYNLFPNKKIAIDLEPKNKNFIKANYLEWKPKKHSKNIIITNPPFGLRGNLALRFINHSCFADIIVMILPPLFNSDGKGTPKKRITTHKLVYSETLPRNSYYYPSGKEVNVSTIFQIWVKKDKFQNIPEINEDYNVDNLIKIYSLSNGNTSSQKRNVKMIGKCDFYLPSTCFKGMKIYKNFNELPNKRGFGIILLKHKTKIIKFLKKINWEKDYAFISTNGAINLRSSLIKKAIYDLKKIINEDELNEQKN